MSVLLPDTHVNIYWCGTGDGRIGEGVISTDMMGIGSHKPDPSERRSGHYNSLSHQEHRRPFSSFVRLLAGFGPQQFQFRNTHLPFFICGRIFSTLIDLVVHTERKRERWRCFCFWLWSEWGIVVNHEELLELTTGNRWNSNVSSRKIVQIQIQLPLTTVGEQRRRRE